VCWVIEIGYEKDRFTERVGDQAGLEEIGNPAQFDKNWQQ